MARVVAYLAGGIIAVLATDFLVSTTGIVASAAVPSEVSIVDRSRKGDRLTVTVRGVAVPKVAIREANEPVRELRRPGGEPSRGVDPASVRSPEAGPERKLLDGCDPSFSPVAAPSLAHITGRCIATLQDTRKFAALHK